MGNGRASIVKVVWRQPLPPLSPKSTVYFSIATCLLMVFVSTNKGMCTPGGMSPGKKVELRSQYLKQLKEIQNLKDEGVLTIEEFQAEKDTIHLTIPMHYVTLYVVVYYMQGL